ncbi:MAG: acyltransferase domain-containing protein [Oligoflexia bacterium]|nr:acyltransferase domain-containing protein [Oligoflexia bacterium]
MTTAFMFPGLNGLLRRSDRNQYLQVPEVQARFREAELLLEGKFGMNLSFDRILSGTTEEIYAVKNVSIAAVIICAIQVGVADRLMASEGEPSWLIGCSLGDLARSVCAGAYRFEDAIVNHIRYTRGIDGIEKIGANIGVATPSQAGFSDEDYRWFDEVQVDVSRLTPRFLNIGGRTADLKKVEARARERGWRTMPILNYPAHSRYILPYVEKIQAEFDEVQVQTPRLPTFSSFSARPISDPDEIRREFLLSITQTIHWDRAIRSLVENHGVTRFVNVGPCRSLSKMMKDIGVNAVTVEAYELIQCREEVAPPMPH